MQRMREIFNDGVPGDATRVLELCAIARQSVQAGDQELALNLLLGAALWCWWADTGPAARVRVAEVTRELTEATGDPRYVATLAVAEPLLECATVMDLLSRFARADTIDGDAQVIDRLELGDWDGAAAAAAEGERLAQDTGQPIWRTGTLVCDAMHNAFRGQVDQALTYAAEVEMVASRQRLNDLLSCVQLARGAAPGR